MNILNQSITAYGQAAFPTRDPNFQDISQHLPLANSSYGSQSMKLFQSPKMKKKKLITASGSSVPRGSYYKQSDLDIKNQREDIIVENEELRSFPTQPITEIKNEEETPVTVTSDTEFKPFTLSFLQSLMENEKMSLIKDVMEELDFLHPDLSETLVVSVSSAVKLDCRQMDQITRKMQRMTGSKNVRLENTIDSSLIAGFVIAYEKEGSHVIDLSVKGQLDELVAHIESTDERIASHSQSWDILNKE